TVTMFSSTCGPLSCCCRACSASTGAVSLFVHGALVSSPLGPSPPGASGSVIEPPPDPHVPLHCWPSSLAELLLLLVSEELELLWSEDELELLWSEEELELLEDWEEPPFGSCDEVSPLVSAGVSSPDEGVASPGGGGGPMSVGDDVSLWLSVGSACGS